jgi:hypothetical protein
MFLYSLGSMTTTCERRHHDQRNARAVAKEVEWLDAWVVVSAALIDGDEPQSTSKVLAAYAIRSMFFRTNASISTRPKGHRSVRLA